MPPTMTGRPRSEGLSRCSTDAKNASRSKCMIDAVDRMCPVSRVARTHPVHTPTVSPLDPQEPARGWLGQVVRRKRGGMTQTHSVYTAHDIPDLLNALPTLFGFRPQESLVAVATRGPR